MQYKQGAKVTAADGKEVGHIDRVVIDPNSRSVTHIVVRQGFLFTEDKVVPVVLIASANEDEVTLRENSEQLNDLPLFEETQYLNYGENDPDAPTVQPGEPGYAQPLLWYPPIGPLTGMNYGVAPYAPSYPAAGPVGMTETTVRNIPENTVALKEGTTVISADGDHVGNVERIFTERDRVTHLLISQGFLFTTQKLVPVTWIRTVTEEEIRLGVKSNTLKSLPEYVGQ